MTSLVRLATAGVFVTALTLGVQTQDVSSIAGTWRVDGAGAGLPWTLTLQVEGSRITGTVRTCASQSGVPSPITDGVIDGKTIRLTCVSRDGNRTITLAGTWKGDLIEFEWQKVVKPGSGATASGDALFGDAAPPVFVAKRVNDDLPTGRGGGARGGAGRRGRGDGGAPPVARPVLGEVHTFKDWVVGCDNTWRCMAESLTPETDPGRRGAPIVVSREAGPDGAVDISITVDGRSTTPVDFVVGRKRVASAQVANGLASVRGAEALTLAAAIADAQQIEVRQGTQVLSRPSLAGSSAALRYIDATQTRAGTATAFVAAGNVGGHTVPAGPAMPLVNRVMAGAEINAAPLTEDERARAVAAAACGRDATAANVEEPPSVVPLSRTSALVLVTCPAANYNSSAVALIANGAAGSRMFVPANFDYPPSSRTSGSVPALVNATWDPAKGVLRSFLKGRSLMDCGSRQEFVWDGAMFRLVEASVMNECRGGTEFIVVWRARTQ